MTSDKSAISEPESKKKRKPTMWVPATGSFKTRLKKARHYLRYQAWVPDDPSQGDTALLIVLCNLRRYHGLREETALDLVRDHYNPRCFTSNGRSWGWDDASLAKKYRQAGKRGMYPTLGVADPKAKRLTARKELHKQLKAFWKRSVRAGGSCTPSELREAFIRFRGGEDVSLNMLSRAVTQVIGAKAAPSFGSRRFVGFHIEGKQSTIHRASHQERAA